MRTNLLQRTLAGLMLAGLSLASQAAAQWKYCQPWNRQLDSHISRVLGCQNPTPNPLQAFDDFVVTLLSQIATSTGRVMVSPRLRNG